MTLKCEVCDKENNLRYKSTNNKFEKVVITNKDKNEIILDFDNKIAYIMFKNFPNLQSIIDIEDVDRIKNIKMRPLLTRKGEYYVVSENKFRLHRFLLNASPEYHVDHIDNNPLNNRKSNLRLCNNSENHMNIKQRADSKTGVTGIHIDSRNGRYIVQIQINGKRKHILSTDDLNKAKYFRYEAEIKYFKEFTPDREEKEKFIKEYELLQENQKVGVQCQ